MVSRGILVGVSSAGEGGDLDRQWADMSPLKYLTILEKEEKKKAWWILYQARYVK